MCWTRIVQGRGKTGRVGGGGRQDRAAAWAVRVSPQLDPRGAPRRVGDSAWTSQCSALL